MSSHSVRILGSLLAGMLIGSLLASLDRQYVASVLLVADPVGKVWLDALRMTVVPLIFALVVTGIASAAGAASAGGLAARALLWFTLLLAASAIMSALLTPLLLA